MITSLSNATIKRLHKLKEAKHRRQENLFLVEGLPEMHRAIQAGYIPHSLVNCPEILTDEAKAFAEKIAPSTEHVLTVSRNVFAKLALREDSNGLLLVFPCAKRPVLEELTTFDFLLILDGIEKPGNVGALMRTATAAGVSAILSIHSTADIYHPHVIRNSLGTCFENKVIATTRAEATAFCHTRGITLYAAWVDEQAHVYDQIVYKRPHALLLGAEHEGLHPDWRRSCEAITIPMKGSIDSLNVSASGAILMYHMRPSA